VDKGKRITVLPYQVIQLAIVNAESESSVGLLDKEDRRRKRRLAWLDKAPLEVFFKETLDLL
jgi:hypothetical protein